MNENKEKREFAQQLEQIAETLTQAVKDANFFTGKQTAPLAVEAMELAALKKLSRLLEN